MIAETQIPVEVRGWVSIGAAAVATFLCLYILVRSPRNVFSNLLAGITAAIALWNAAEAYRLLSHEVAPRGVDGGLLWPMSFMFVGISLLPALLTHFALSFMEQKRICLVARVVAYVIAGAFSLLALGGLGSEKIMDFIDREESPNYNMLYIWVQGPVILGMIALFIYRYLTARANVRGIYGWVLLSVLIGAPCGLFDLAAGTSLGGLQIGNVGVLLSCVCIAIVVVRHREFFDALARLSAQSARLFDSTRHGLLTLDASGRVLSANAFSKSLLGGRPATVGELDESLHDLLRKGGQCYVPRGGRILKATAVKPEVVEEIGEVSAKTHLLIEDATREFELLHQLSQRESVAALGEAAATLAHEIQNPLTAVGAFVETLAGGADADPVALESVRAEVRRLGDLVARSLDLARLTILEREVREFDPLVVRTLESILRDGSVRFEPGVGVKSVLVDPDRFRQLLQNLLLNATESGASEVCVRTRVEDAHAVLEVWNDGPPVPADVLGRMFDPYVTTKPRGTGLGLPLCAKIVKAHGGAIEARNTEPGVLFEVTIPWTS